MRRSVRYCAINKNYGDHRAAKSISFRRFVSSSRDGVEQSLARLSSLDQKAGSEGRAKRMLISLYQEVFRYCV